MAGPGRRFAVANIRGTRELRKTLDALPDRVRTRILGAMAFEMAKVAKRTARRLVPVRTGRLRRSIMAKRMVVRGPDGQKRKGARLKAGANWAAHASLIEYGFQSRSGSAVGPFPYIRPALERHHSRMIRAATGRARRLLPRAVKAARRQAARGGV